MCDKSDDPTKRVNLLDGDFLCCGAMCPKQEAQAHIDRMQRAIDAAYEHICYGGYADDTLADLRKELNLLSSN